MKILGERMRQLRLENGISVSEMAVQIGVSQPTLSNYEAGNRMPDVKLILKYAEYFGCTTDYLFGKENSREVSENKVYEEEMENFRTSLKSIHPHSKAKIIVAFNRLCESWGYIRSIWNEDELDVSINLFTEFIKAYDELHSRLAEFPYYSFNEAPRTAILDHTLSVLDTRKDFNTLVDNIMASAISRITQNVADVN